MELKIKINDKASLHLNIKEEMSLAEFTAMAGIVSKIDRYSFNIKKEVSGLKGKRKYSERVVLTDQEKKKFINDWENADSDGRQKIAESLNMTRARLSDKVGYYRLSLKKSKGGRK